MNEVTTADILHLLSSGEIRLEGVLPWSSNYTFLATVHGRFPHQDALVEIPAVYKPRSGERPLWDFPTGTLSQRERAAFFVSHAIGWELIPPTILRQGPRGLGSLQFFIHHDPEKHYFTIEGDPTFRQQLQQIALLDIIINNADRKGGHILIEEDEDEQPRRIWAIDHGICFHAEYKLRTVIWEFAGQPIPKTLLDDLQTFCHQLATAQSTVRLELEALLAPYEIEAFQKRIDNLITNKKFIIPGPGRHYPWPPV